MQSGALRALLGRRYGLAGLPGVRRGTHGQALYKSSPVLGISFFQCAWFYSLGKNQSKSGGHWIAGAVISFSGGGDPNAHGHYFCGNWITIEWFNMLVQYESVLHVLQSTQKGLRSAEKFL